MSDGYEGKVDSPNFAKDAQKEKIRELVIEIPWSPSPDRYST